MAIEDGLNDYLSAGEFISSTHDFTGSFVSHNQRGMRRPLVPV
jgi:hypothetical protein